MLRIENLHAYYDAVEALKGIDMQVERGKMTCLIGSNGAGKSTLLNAISGMIHKTGSIIFNGNTDISNLNSRQIAKLGIAHVPEGRHVFPGLTTQENLEMGAISWHGLFGRRNFGRELEMVYELFPRLKERHKQLAWSMSGGEQQMLAIGRGLMSRPKLLLLDEPSMGLAPVLVDELFDRIVEINKTGMTVLLNEQNARIAMRISDYTYVIEQGKICMHGPSSELKDDPRIISAYLGVRQDEIMKEIVTEGTKEPT